MPELPEVETVRRALARMIVGTRIARVHVRLPRLIRTPSDPVAFAERLAGRTFAGIGRHGKYLLFAVPPFVLVSHMRMEGKYDVVPSGTPDLAHTHIAFELDDGRALKYRDVRQFGTFDLVDEERIDRLPLLRTLGPDALDPALDAEAFYAILKGRPRRAIKALLLDQTVIAGLGNIYTDEALFRARIHPRTPAGAISPVKAQKLHAAVREVLEAGIESGGASVRSYRGPQEALGYFQLNIQVYGRKDQPCPRCGTPIVRTVVAGRGTHLCPKCQREGRQGA
ncbi:MAG: bifunctional DNA-formamidopyrimidine glycosylase/DNA-(apurinic or apyrimidinic site) lyase [Hydrogenibacillus sp.]|nr:bifunctional DNA-formamidopyrimidine glycosylase/DNA-(apurinic or apyrimidinic site) lyase [Hydrogenibacillus sp.]